MGRDNGNRKIWLFFFFFFFFFLKMLMVAASYPKEISFQSDKTPTRLLSATHLQPQDTKTDAKASRVYHVIDYGADPTGKIDATDAIMRAISDAFTPVFDSDLLAGIRDLGGAEVHLDGGSYLLYSPIRLPSSGGGNFKIHGGSLHASNEFPTDRYLIEFSSSSPSPSHKDYEYITVRDVMLDGNYRSGGIAVVNSLRTSLDNLYIVHFSSDGIFVKGGHETYVRNSYLGQHITAGGDPQERNFSGTGINLSGNDNVVTDVAIFSAATGILVQGQANTLTNVHCYNKATGWGGVGIYIKLPSLTQTRITNCYMDYTGIVAEDPVQLLISSTFFLGDANIVLKSVKGVVKGVNIVDNMFAGSDKGTNIVGLDGDFSTVENVVVDRNNVRGMQLKSTIARGKVSGNGNTWSVDFASVLLFPEKIDNVQYSLRVTEDDRSGLFVEHGIKNLTGNSVVVEANRPVSATVHVNVVQAL